MAAALVMLTNWRKDRPFYDPVCGSGTICIEAALITITLPLALIVVSLVKHGIGLIQQFLKKYVTKPRQRQTTMLN